VLAGAVDSRRVLETTVQLSGAVMSRWKRAFKSGWSKHGKGLAGVHGDEQGIDVLGAVVAVEIAGDGAAGGGYAGDEVRGDAVPAGGEIAAGDDEVPVSSLRFGGGAVDGDVGDGAVPEVEDHWVLGGG